jgi:16S rRNA G966 N2-methylase RsmD
MTHTQLRPIDMAFKPAKQHAKRHYGSHPYFTKRAWNVVQEYIKHFTREGDCVLDPFGGSGVTSIEALALRRRTIYVDISEWARFLARSVAFAPVDLNLLDKSFSSISSGCREYILSLYEKTDAEIQKMRLRYWVPRGFALPSNADVLRVEDLFTRRMLLALSALLHHIRQEPDSVIRDQILLAFSATLAKVNLTFLSAHNRKESRGGSSIFSIYRYKVAARPVELNVWEQFDLRFRKLRAAKAETNQLIGAYFLEPEHASFLKASATDLSAHVQAESVDYIYTDPPYGGHIAYLDLSTMWCAWLGLSISQEDRINEVVVGGELKKSEQDYSTRLRLSLREMARTLKDGRWLSIVFAHWDSNYWHLIVDTCQESGLAYVNTVAQPVGTVWSMHKKKNPLNVISGEWVLNFRKTRRRNGRPKRPTATLDQIVHEAGEKCIVRNIGASTEALYTHILPPLLESGLLKAKNGGPRDLRLLLDRFFLFVPRLRKWYLKPDRTPSPELPFEQRIRYCAASVVYGIATVEGPKSIAAIHRFVCARLGNGSSSVSFEKIRSALRGLVISMDDENYRAPAEGTQLELFDLPKR